MAHRRRGTGGLWPGARTVRSRYRREARGIASGHPRTGSRRGCRPRPHVSTMTQPCETCHWVGAGRGRSQSNNFKAMLVPSLKGNGRNRVGRLNIRVSITSFTCDRPAGLPVCVPKTKSKRIDDEVRPSWRAKLWGRSRWGQMLKGFTAPRSPLGIAALVPSPLWHFAGDVLAVEFWNDPDVSIHTLPTGVELDRKRPGHSVALFTDYQFTAQNSDYLDPARYQCRGFSVLLDAMWKGSRIAWCPYCYVDNDAALMRGWIQGYPKNSARSTRPVVLPLWAQLRRHSCMIAGFRPACRPTVVR
jgi:Acetoacetate decarboxylase (ADC)